MPATHFICPDNEQIKISKCLKNGGCRMGKRCATRPYLRLIGFDREWKGISPSSAGNGPRLLYLKATTDYAIDPQSRVWAAFGTSTHEKLGMHHYINDVLSEETLSDDKMQGIADTLDVDEFNTGRYVLTDYKTWGSFKVAKALGLIIEKKDVPILDDDGNHVLLKSGKNKGKPKTKVEAIRILDPIQADLLSETLQINRYRMFFENAGFPISRMEIQAIPRDGGTYVAKGRGIEKNLYIISVPIMQDNEVHNFYDFLQAEVDEAFKTGYIRKCNEWESWEGRRCDGFCEVAEQCKEMGE